MQVEDANLARDEMSLNRTGMKVILMDRRLIVFGVYLVPSVGWGERVSLVMRSEL